MQPSSAPESKNLPLKPAHIFSPKTFNLPIFGRPSSRGFGVLSPIAPPAFLDRAGVEDLPLKPCSFPSVSNRRADILLITVFDSRWRISLS
ncbi:unnamed protein product [Linum tenue]|uniref:Uncharacterized protein n=1 Tax=Linum tenue TaxID=586396 RepID=A0AAV0RAB3_9ROSI|nr:unnamed protein product [Linum tenue]